MHKLRLHTFSSLLVLLALLCATNVIITHFGTADAQTATAVATDLSCTTGNQIAIDNTSGTTATTLSPNFHKVSLAVNPVLLPNIKSVVFILDTDTKILGRGTQLATNPYYEMQWQTQLTTPGTHTVGALINLTNGVCKVNPIPVNVAPVANMPTGTLGNLAVVSNPPTFEGFTNEPRNFVLNAAGQINGNGYDVSAWSNFKVSPPTLGALTSDGTNIFRFSAGPEAGTSTIAVTVQYAGLTKVINIPVKITASTTATAATASTSSTTATTQPKPDGTAAATTAASSPATLEADLPVKNCVVSKIGDARYKVITAGTTRPTATEFETFLQCFAVRNYVLSSSFIPVEPKKDVIKEKPATKDIKVSGAKSETATVNNIKKQTLKFSGEAKPNTTVLMYIFSEPLVVSTSADANGDWSYSLEDPLEPGNHEAYALVNKGDGNYERSSVFSFAIAKVSAAAENPNGLSLDLEPNQATANKDDYSVTMYITAVAILVTIVILVAWLWLRKHGHGKNTAVTISPTVSPAQSTEETEDTKSKAEITEQADLAKAIGVPETSEVTTDVPIEPKKNETETASSQETPAESVEKVESVEPIEEPAKADSTKVEPKKEELQPEVPDLEPEIPEISEPEVPHLDELPADVHESVNESDSADAAALEAATKALTERPDFAPTPRTMLASGPKPDKPSAPPIAEPTDDKATENTTEGEAEEKIEEAPATVTTEPESDTPDPETSEMPAKSKVSTLPIISKPKSKIVKVKTDDEES